MTSESEHPTVGSLTNAGTTTVTFADGLNEAGTVVLTSADKQDGLKFTGTGDGLTFVSAQQADSTYQLQVVAKPMLPAGGSDALAQKIAQAGQDAGKTVTSVTVEEGCQQSNETGAILPDSTNITLLSSIDNGETWQEVTAETVTATDIGREVEDGTRYLRVDVPNTSTRYRVKASKQFLIPFLIPPGQWQHCPGFYVGYFRGG